MNIIKYKYWFIGFSGALVILAIVSMAVFGFKQGIDFVGGTLWQIRSQSEDTVGVEKLQQVLSERHLEGMVVRQGASSKDFLIRMKEITEEEHQQLIGLLGAKLGTFEELSFSSIGPAIGRELRNRAVTAFFLVLLGISLYVSFAFRKVSQPVSSWKYGAITLLTLFHDALIPAGAFAWWGWQYGAEVDSNFIVALLVVMGFSVHDTIVVFDRIRENLIISKGKFDFEKVVNESVNQTLVRSVNTSLTLVLVLIALYFFGAASLGYFILLILIGTVVGTYSSIFVASPLLVLLNNQNRPRH